MKLSELLVDFASTLSVKATNKEAKKYLRSKLLFDEDLRPADSIKGGYVTYNNSGEHVKNMFP
jgi:hypothetical protein